MNIRKMFAEFLGTMMLVSIGTGSVVLNGANDKLMIGLAFGIAVIGAVYAFGYISGGHFNPVVSIAMAISGRLSWLNVAYYAFAQLLGAFAGTGIVFGFLVAFGKTNQQISETGFAQTDFPKQMSPISALLIEAFLTYILVLVILMVTSKNNSQKIAPIIIGLVLSALIVFGISATGASLNPFRSFAPAIFAAFFGKTAALSHYWVYVLGPLLGAVLAAFTTKYLFKTEK